MTVNTFTILTCFLFWSALQLTAQTGPGGVGNTAGTSNLVLWLQADVGVATSGGGVTTWSDQSGHNNDVSNSLATARPTLQTNGSNAMPYLRFDGTDDCLQTAGVSADFSPTESSVFVVGKGALNQTVISIAETGMVDEMLLRGSTIFHHSSSGNFQTKGHQCLSSIPSTEARILGGIWGTTRTDVQFYTNGVLSTDNLTSAGNGGWDFDNVNRIARIGCRAIGEYLDGDLYEVIVYNRKLTASEQESVEDYLRCKYDITNNGCGNLSTAPCPVTSVLPTAQRIQILPNPASTTLTIQVENTVLRHIEVIDVPGRILQTLPIPDGSSNTHTLDVQAYPAGVYFVRVIDQSRQRHVYKFIKQ